MKKILGFICMLVTVLSLSACNALDDIASNIDAEKTITIEELRNDVKKLSAHPYTKATITGKTNGEDFAQEDYTYADGEWSEATEEKNHRSSLTYTLSYYESYLDSLASDLQKEFTIYTYTISDKYKIVYTPDFNDNEYIKEWTWTCEFDKYGCLTSRYEKLIKADNTTTVTDYSIQYQ